MNLTHVFSPGANYTADAATTGGDQADLFKIIFIGFILVVIMFGNSLLIVASLKMRPKHVAELLVTSLAVIDLINGCGPVAMSTAFYVVRYTTGGDIYTDRHMLCQFYSFLATTLRTSSCILTGFMAIDRAVCVALPLYYRTRLRASMVKGAVGLLMVLSVALASLPAFGLATVSSHDSLCLFAYNSDYALSVAVIGYVQLICVIVSYVIVICKIVSFLQRQLSIRISQQQTTSVGNIKLSPNVGSGGRPLDKRRRSSRVDAVRELKSSRETRTITLLMATVVLVFCASWMPIVIAITRDWINNRVTDSVYLLSARMSLISSTVNPVIYALLSRRYRRSYWASLRMIFCCSLETSKDGNTMKSRHIQKSPQISSRHAAVMPTNTPANHKR